MTHIARAPHVVARDVREITRCARAVCGVREIMDVYIDFTGTLRARAHVRAYAPACKLVSNVDCPM